LKQPLTTSQRKIIAHLPHLKSYICHWN
jgi:hypothetical protein